MAVPFRKISKTRRDMRRTHYKVTANGLVKCSNCGEMIRPHRVCDKCGMLSPCADSYNEALAAAIDAGWLHVPDGNKDYCPDCRKEME